MLTTAQLAKQLGVTKCRVYQLARLRRVAPVVSIPGRLFWSDDAAARCRGGKIAKVQITQGTEK